MTGRTKLEIFVDLMESEGDDGPTLVENAQMKTKGSTAQRS